MHVQGHWLDASTGKELPIVKLTLSEWIGDTVVLTSRDFRIELEDRHSPMKLVMYAKYYVALTFNENPDYTKAFRQMMNHVFEGPRVLPEIVAINGDLALPLESLRRTSPE